MGDILSGAGVEVVNADDLAACFKQFFSEIRAEKTNFAGDEDAFCYFIFLFLDKYLIQT